MYEFLSKELVANMSERSLRVSYHSVLVDKQGQVLIWSHCWECSARTPWVSQMGFKWDHSM